MSYNHVFLPAYRNKKTFTLKTVQQLSFCLLHIGGLFLSSLESPYISHSMKRNKKDKSETKREYQDGNLTLDLLAQKNQYLLLFL